MLTPIGATKTLPYSTCSLSLIDEPFTSFTYYSLHVALSHSLFFTVFIISLVLFLHLSPQVLASVCLSAQPFTQKAVPAQQAKAAAHNSHRSRQHKANYPVNYPVLAVSVRIPTLYSSPMGLVLHPANQRQAAHLSPALSLPRSLLHSSLLFPLLRLYLLRPLCCLLLLCLITHKHNSFLYSH